jgi:uncharacterized protein
MRRFKILSIDGGGIKGVFPAALLAALEEDLGVEVREYFDLIAGTSTGGIIALSLGLGLAPKALLDFYLKEGPKIFPQPKGLKRVLWLASPSRYDPSALKTALTAVFEKKLLGDSATRLFIPSFDANSGLIHIYKTAHHERLRRDHRCTAVEVAMATSAAPIYFPSFKSDRDVTLIDGGIWANNPTGLAVVEAISMLNARPDSIDVLSIGCTDTPPDYRATRKWFGYWAPKLLDVVFRGQSFASLGIAQHLAGHANVYRVNPTVAPGQYKLDKTKGIQDLKGLGYATARYESAKLKPVFFGSKAQAFTPLYGRDEADAARLEPPKTAPKWGEI